MRKFVDIIIIIIIITFIIIIIIIILTPKWRYHIFYAQVD
jgi:type IV secretory pathway component VirB8